MNEFGLMNKFMAPFSINIFIAAPNFSSESWLVLEGHAKRYQPVVCFVEHRSREALIGSGGIKMVGILRPFNLVFFLIPIFCKNMVK